ncbi:hypothetical protein GCM10017688_52970 [Streptomyces ramulosus]
MGAANPHGTVLDITSPVRVDVEAWRAERHDMGVCDAIPGRESAAEPRNIAQQKAAFPAPIGADLGK